MELLQGRLVIAEEDLTPTLLLEQINSVLRNPKPMLDALAHYKTPDSVNLIYQVSVLDCNYYSSNSFKYEYDTLKTHYNV